MGRFARAFGLSEANERTVKITRSYTVLRALDTIALMMTIPFLFIHMADLLGGGPGQYLEGMTLLGILMVINMATQVIHDFPIDWSFSTIWYHVLITVFCSVWNTFLVFRCNQCPHRNWRCSRKWCIRGLVGQQLPHCSSRR